MTAAVTPQTTDPALLALRRAAVMRHPVQRGIDHVDAGTSEAGDPVLTVFFLHGDGPGAGKAPRPDGLTAGQVGIWADDGQGGRTPQNDLAVTGLTAPGDTPDAVVVTLGVVPEHAAAVAATVYRLELSGVAELDPFFMTAPFTLNTVLSAEPSAPATLVAPGAPGEVTDYLARDYASVRALMLDRLSASMPDWQDTEPADLVHTVVEVLAYAADQLAYYQDAVATEAYLGTARRRTSVRRHARLLDYALHEGCDARVWARFEVGGTDPLPLPAGTRLLTRVDALEPARPLLDPPDVARAVAAGATVFETVRDAVLHPGLGTLALYDWGLPGYILPAGATDAVLAGEHPDLAAGQVLLLRAAPGTPEDDDGTPLVHPVRLTDVGHGETDPVGDDGHGAPIIGIAWDLADALPQALTVSPPGGGPSGTAWGNVVLADHGHTGPPEPLPVRGGAPDPRPRLVRTGLTWREDLPADVDRRPASEVARREPRRAVPALHVTGTDETGRETTWTPRPDLLASDRLATDFVAEMENDGTAYLRFGDGEYGRQVTAAGRLTATYRVGSGTAGNIGRGTLAHLAVPTGAADTGAGLARIVSVTNPLPATGGTDPEPIDQVRLLAPQSFMTQERCVVEEDFVRVAESHSGVQKATASVRWTGSWHTTVVVVERPGGLPVDRDFHDELLAWFEPYRLAGGDLDIRGPRPVAVDVLLEIGVADGHQTAGVERDLLAAFGTGTGPDGAPAFFNPVNVAAGAPLYLSRMVARAAASPGVAWADVVRFQRRGQAAGREIDLGVLAVGPQEVLRVLPGDVAFVFAGGG